MKVSILIANYNNGKFFKECWQSILNQTYTNWEVIIVDDYSSDDSVATIESIIVNHPNVSVFKNQKNMGCGFSKRKCVEHATGNYAFFLDPDDYISKDAIEKLLNAFSIHINSVLIYSNLQRYDTKGTFYPERVLKQVINGSSMFFNLSGDVSALAMFSMNAYSKTIGIDPFLKRAVDQDLYLKLYEVGEFRCLNEILYFYRIHDSGISTGANIMKAEYWQWMVIVNTAKRRGLNLEDLFVERYAFKKDLDQEIKKNDLLRNSKSYKIGLKITNVIKFITFKK